MSVICSGSTFRGIPTIEPAVGRSSVGEHERGIESLEWQHRAAWQHIIDWRLVEWGSRPHLDEDEDFTPPSRACLDAAISLAACAARMGAIPPNRVMRDGSAGVVFELDFDGRLFVRMEVSGTGEVTRYYFAPDGSLQT